MKMKLKEQNRKGSKFQPFVVFFSSEGQFWGTIRSCELLKVHSHIKFPLTTPKCGWMAAVKEVKSPSHY